MRQLMSLHRSQAVIEFSMDGSVLTANENFLTLLGYRLDEIVGRPHAMFLDDATRQSSEYREFWTRLRRGEFLSDEFKRTTKAGTEVWIQATYNPVFDDSGRPVKVVKFASNITTQKFRMLDLLGQISAIQRSNAVIEFSLEGTVQTANENFLAALGYRLEEIKGRHHSMFVAEAERGTQAYRDFWAALNRGEFVAGEFLRMGKGGREIWIQASYNPIFDTAGRVLKVVKFASDVTKQVKARMLAQTLSTNSLVPLATQLSSVSSNMLKTASETSAQATAVSAAAEQVSANIQTVAASTEEMSASIREIAGNSAQAARVAREAVTLASGANKTVTKLGESSSEIGKVIRVITAIAQQTKLLALNATIEAARAGEAGKGFAVVANEVKELAKETAKATEDIGQKIEAIQTDTESAVVAIGQISEIIGQINEIQTSIAGAVEEQTATTNEMSRNVTEGATGVAEIARNITSVAKAADTTSKGAAESLQGAKNLSEVARSLQEAFA